VNHELTEEIKHMLEQQCLSRCLDDEEDFEIVVEVIAGVIDRWIDDRCPGCR
jgi:hypothetical protein